MNGERSLIDALSGTCFWQFYGLRSDRLGETLIFRKMREALLA